MEDRPKKKLVLFTLQFPYGNSENYLETEMHYVSKAFDAVHVISSEPPSTEHRPVPENFFLHSVGVSKTKFDINIFLRYLRYFIQIWLYSIIHSKKRGRYIKSIKSLMHYFQIDIGKRDRIKEIINANSLNEAVYYDYWLVNSSLTLLYMRKRGEINGPIICRAHGFDLYDDRHIEQIVPFKEYRAKKIDRLITISEHGKKYLQRQLGPLVSRKIQTHYLGVRKPPMIRKESTGERIIVSVSSLIPLKQVDKIAQALSKVKSTVCWVHFGDGPEKEKIRGIIAEMPNHVSVDLMGEKPNNEILSFYSSQPVVLLISLSSSEGLPVSMMEAQSYGIPILAPAVNGIPEIVNEKTGVLLPLTYRLEDVTQSVEMILQGEIKFDHSVIRSFYEENFCADFNYPRFTREVLLN